MVMQYNANCLSIPFVSAICMEYDIKYLCNQYIDKYNVYKTEYRFYCMY